MPKYFYYFLLTGYLFPFLIQAQSPLAIERKSPINLELKHSEKRSFSIVLDENDLLSIKSQAEGTINLKISDPNGQVVYQGLIKSNLVDWQKTVTTAGSYTVEAESAALLLNTRISLSITVLKPNFSYGSAKMDTVINKRSKTVLVDGEFQITRNTPKSYNYNVLKGDTLIFMLKPISGHNPAIEIVNSLNELVYAAFSGKKEQYIEIPILEAGSYTLSINSVAYLPKTNYLRVELISPKRYAEIPKEEKSGGNKEPDLPVDLYDTIPEVYMDTIIFLGAQRDIINPKKAELNFQFEKPSTIVKWLVFYGAGSDFLEEIAAYEPILQGEAMAAGATNILAAFGLGLLKKLPNQGNNQISFTPSAAIRNGRMSPTQDNYSTIKGGYGSHSLLIENKSQSSGQNVHVQVVVFRKIYIEPQ